MGWLIHYIDNFLTAGKPASPQCQQNLTCIEKACADLGVPLKREKVVGPTTSLDFLGIVLDTEAMELRLPDEKVTQLKGLLEEWLVKKSCRKRELLSFIGKLAHACKIVRVGRIFLRRFIDYSMKAKRLDHWIHLSIDFREDVAWWQAFLQTWNHRSMMHLISHGSPPNVIFSSDASGNWGCAEVWQHRWLQWQWEPTWAVQHIAIKELLPVVLACAVWGSYWQYCTVLVKCDNIAVVHS